MLKIVLRLLLMIVGLGAPVFAGAGRWDLPFAWAYFAVLISAMVVIMLVADKDLLRERAKPPAGGVDRGLRFIAMPFFLAHLLVAGLDVGRYHWSGQLSVGVQIGALIALALSLVLSGWAMRVNRFYSPVVRIQSERGHHVITAGPYAWIRHPGYTGALVMIIVGGPALGSWWSGLVLVPMLVLILRRVVIEDRYLHENLPGYAAYATRVRYRLAPCIW